MHFIDLSPMLILVEKRLVFVFVNLVIRVFCIISFEKKDTSDTFIDIEVVFDLPRTYRIV